MRSWPVRMLYREYLADPGGFVGRVETVHNRLRSYLRAWERHGVRIGVPSWVWPHWIGLLYRDWYGSREEFAHRSLREYVRCFNTACLAIGPHTAPDMRDLRWLSAGVPDSFAFTVVVTDESLMYRFPYGHPDRARRGEKNDRFLDASLFEERIEPHLESLGSRIGMCVLAIQRVYRTEQYRFPEFLEKVRRFLAFLPHGRRYAVELGNPEYLVPEYFDCLRQHMVGHVVREYAGMPSVLDQLHDPATLTAPWSVVLGSPGRNGDLAAWMRSAIRRCVDERVQLTAYVQEQEGPAVPLALMKTLEDLSPELARLSPIRRRAA